MTTQTYWDCYCCSCWWWGTCWLRLWSPILVKIFKFTFCWYLVETFKLVLGQDSEDVWSKFVQELVIWPKEVTLVSRTQPSGPLCLWQCLKCKIRFIYGSVSAGREKWPFNVLFFFKVEPPCDQTWWDSLVFSILSCFSYVLDAENTSVGPVGPF